MEFYDYVKMCQDETSGFKNEKSGQNMTQNDWMPTGDPKRMGNQMLMDERRMMDDQRPMDKRRPAPPPGPDCRGQIYKVQKGDTLYSISRKYNLKVRDLMQANPFVNVYQLQIGEELCIPVVPNNPQEPGVQPYVVKREDTVLSILNDKKISFQELARLNRSAQVLKFPAGTVLLLPR